jgi:hypothetical protein
MENRHDSDIQPHCFSLFFTPPIPEDLFCNSFDWGRVIESIPDSKRSRSRQ